MHVPLPQLSKKQRKAVALEPRNASPRQGCPALASKNVSAKTEQNRQTWRGQGFLYLSAMGLQCLTCVFTDSPSHHPHPPPIKILWGLPKAWPAHRQISLPGLFPSVLFLQEAELFSTYLLFLQKKVGPSHCPCFVHSTEPQGSLALFTT